MSNARRLRRRLRRLWDEDPRCHWCKQLTLLVLVPPGARIKHKIPNMATIDHLRSRLDPTRRESNPENECRTVLACSTCNNRRAKEEQAQLPIEELRKRSSNHTERP